MVFPDSDGIRSSQFCLVEMGLSKRLLTAATALAWTSLSGETFAVSLGPCPPPGPVLPAPIRPSADPDVQAVVNSFGDSLDALTVSFDASAVSVAVQSIHEDQPFFSFHYPPTSTPRARTRWKVDGDTMYRIARISKLYTIIGVMLLDGVRMDDPITKYLAQLRDLERQAGEPVNEITTPDWDEITLVSMASHKSGLGSDTVRTRAPVHSPFTSVVYSNVGIGIISLVVEVVSGKSFDDYIQDAILESLGLNSTFPNRPPSHTTRGFIPDTTPGSNWWDADLGPWFSS